MCSFFKLEKTAKPLGLISGSYNYVLSVACAFLCLHFLDKAVPQQLADIFAFIEKETLYANTVVEMMSLPMTVKN